MTEMLRLVITADADQAVKKIKQLGGVTDDAGKSTDELGKKSKQAGVLMKAGLVAGATAAAYAMVRFGASSVKAAAEAEQAQMRLDDAFSKFPKLADSSADALRSLNTELQKKTRFDDDALASGQAILAQFDLTGRQLEDVTPLVADYAAKMGLDIPEAATNVGKALLGNTRALKSLGIDYTLTGDRATDFANITELMGRKVGGFAEKDGKTAAGQLAILNNQFGELQETVGKALIPALSGLVTGATAVVSTFGALPGPVQQVALGIAGVTIAAGVVVPWIAKMKTAMEALGVTSASVSGKLAVLAKAGIAAGFVALAAAIQKTASDTMALVDSLDATARSGESFTQRMERLRDASAEADGVLDVYASGIDNLGDLLGTAGQGAGDLWASILQGENAVDRLREAQAAAQAEILKYGQAVREVADANGYSEASLVALLDTMDTEGKTYLEIKAELAGVAEAKANATVASDGLAESTETLADDLADATDKANAYRKAIDLMGGGVLDVNDAQADFNQAVADGAATLAENAGAVDLNTEAGRKNFDALKAMRDGAVALAGAVYEQTGDLAAANGVLEANKQRLYAAGAQAGLTAAQVDALVGKINAIPPKRSTELAVSTAAATRTIDEWVARQSARRINIGVAARPGGAGGIPVGAAAGGRVSGPGTGTSDSIPAWLSDGEYVIRAAAVDKYGVGTFDRLNAMEYASGGLAGAASAAAPLVAVLPRPPAANAGGGDLGTITLVVREESGIERLRKEIRVNYGGDAVAALGFRL